MKNLFFFLLMLVSAVAFGQHKNCEKFKDGKFKIEDSEFGDSYIERKGSKQMEYGEGSGLKLKFKVKWLNTCTYTLELKKIIENPNNLELPEGMILTVEILETNENSYLQKSSSNLDALVVQSEMIRMD